MDKLINVGLGVIVVLFIIGFIVLIAALHGMN